MFGEFATRYPALLSSSDYTSSSRSRALPILMYPSHSHAHLPPFVSLRPALALRSVVLFSSWYEYDPFERIHGRLRVKVGGAIHVSGHRLLSIFHAITKELVNQRHHPASSLDSSLIWTNQPVSPSRSGRCRALSSRIYVASFPRSPRSARRLPLCSLPSCVAGPARNKHGH